MKEKLKEPFLRHARDIQEQLDGGWEKLQQQEEVVRQWPVRKKRLTHVVLEPLRKWVEALKKMAQPLKNIKRYKKEKKRLNRAKYPSFYSWGGFMKRFQILIARSFNIVRILVILSVYFSILLLVGYLIMKLFTAIKG
ncbi:MAG: hypothetical protein GY940_17985 [bacterium]|nr:hypothetical protein [bacterium]